jgi:molecular chaperone GrpE
MKKSNAPTEKKPSAAVPPTPASPPPAAEPLVHLEPATVNAEQLEELKQRAAKADEHWDRLLRTAADFENFKKRAAREKQDAIKYANENLMQKLIPVLESLDIALAAPPSTPPDTSQSFQTGVNLICQQLKGVLAEAGLEELNAVGKPFDPHFHEAVSQQETPEMPEGHVVQQLRKGYKLRDRLLRPASVIVAKPPAA